MSYDLKTKQRQQRSKSGAKWPRWLRNPRLLRWAFFFGRILHRIWRWWVVLEDLFDG